MLWSNFYSKKIAAKLIKVLSIIVSAFLVTSCSAPRNLVLSCQESHIEIYVDGQFIGRELVNYTVPKGQMYVVVSCHDNGIEVYSKKVYTDDLKRGNLIELQIPKNLKYSNNRPY